MTWTTKQGLDNPMTPEEKTALKSGKDAEYERHGLAVYDPPLTKEEKSESSKK